MNFDKTNPRNLTECFDILDEILPNSEKDHIKSSKDMIEYHHGLGTRIRNTWKLWHDGLLTNFFSSLGITHADDMSGIILTSYQRKLKGLPIELAKQAQYYKSYWEESKKPNFNYNEWQRDMELKGLSK